MKIINTIEDLRLVLEASKEMGKWEAWHKHYYIKYQEIFDYKLSNLYRADISLYQHLVETMDFEVWHKTLERFEETGLYDKLRRKVNQVIEDLAYELDFDVYLLAGFGHVAGTAGLMDRPFVYYGLETLLSEEEVNRLIPHELNHMMRNSLVTQHKSLNGIKFGEMLVSEGLGTVYPLTLEGSWTLDDLGESALKSIEKYQRMHSQSDDYVSRGLDLFDMPVDDHLFKEHFMIDNSNLVDDAGQGYYVGSHIIASLIQADYDIKDLTYMRAQEIIQLYKDQIK